MESTREQYLNINNQINTITKEISDLQTSVTALKSNLNDLAYKILIDEKLLSKDKFSLEWDVITHPTTAYISCYVDDENNNQSALNAVFELFKVSNYSSISLNKPDAQDPLRIDFNVEYNDEMDDRPDGLSLMFSSVDYMLKFVIDNELNIPVDSVLRALEVKEAELMKEVKIINMYESKIRNILGSEQ